MAPRLSGQSSLFGVVFFVSKSLLGTERQKKLEKFAILTRTPRSHVRILKYRMWSIAMDHGLLEFCIILKNCVAKLELCTIFYTVPGNSTNPSLVHCSKDVYYF